MPTDSVLEHNATMDPVYFPAPGKVKIHRLGDLAEGECFVLGFEMAGDERQIWQVLGRADGHVSAATVGDRRTVYSFRDGSKVVRVRLISVVYEFMDLVVDLARVRVPSPPEPPANTEFSSGLKVL